MTNREREFANLGFEYAEGIENCNTIALPSGRHIYRTDHNSWEVQPWNDNYWLESLDLLDAIRIGSKPKQ